MSKWEVKRVSEIVDIINGGTPKTEVSDYWNGGIYWLSVNDFSGDSRWVYKSEKTITDKGLENSATNLLEKGDIIISARGTVGEIAQIGLPMAFNQSNYGLRAKSNYSNDYIYYSLKHQLKYFKQIANGAVFDTIIRATFDHMKISVPPLPTQHRIAEILSAYDDLIENNSRCIILLEKATQELYKEWFVRFRFPGYKKTRFEDGIPKGWEVKRLGEVVNITSSKRIYLSDYVDKGIPFYRSKEVIQSANGESLTEPLYILEDKYNELKNKFGVPSKNDILITSVGTIGISWLVDDRVFYFKDGNLTWLQSGKTPQSALYIFLWLNSDIGKNALFSSTIGTSQSALTIENLNKIKLIMPEVHILDVFYEKAGALISQKRILQTQSQNLDRQRDLLLPRLLSGKLEV
ncbi:restriction modification system DNA specificity domain protein [Treponema primitia ZAS-2]|uniref:Restriction modification system DNA specificity domain protein n=1 Tax=Treponema primitia (strain ATCC BAA-887 / DSM 12427 / ZAS-2) TaxID=545694 RepID=F5YQJ9_TREPZ|nr:restriction endonuclease subunit S [Treponema primitia]AEF84230.1 restriction modification system DNA specificity domain protein [Treponema primitia ZAS-2]